DVYADFLTPEFTLEGTPEHKWEACRGIGTSFGYNRFEGPDDYIDPKALIHMFVDIVARGGNLLLNIAPTPTGQVPWEQASRVMALGWWMRQYGSAIYGTRPWERINGITGDAIDVRYTVDDEAVHAIVLGTPMDIGTADAYLQVDVSLDEGATVELENRPGTLAWESTPGGTRVKLPEIPDPSPAMAIRMSPPDKVRPFQET
ncbi:MAG TPA: alpha-L-fucosidase, partial [Conexibacter sp.]|nr:alpha-L-fucosidase [Conexibacter sp.]